MKVYDAASIRNVALVGHTGSGKTQLASAILAIAGMVNRFGKVDDGTTVTDFDEEEIARKHTLSASLAYAEWNKHKINLIDTPGMGNFLSDARAALHVADAALVVVDAVAGVMVQTEKVWEAAQRARICRGWSWSTGSIASARASSARCESLRDACSRTVMPIQLPIGEEKNVPRRRRSRHAARRSSFRRDESGKFTEGAVPADMSPARRSGARGADRDGRGSRRNADGEVLRGRHADRRGTDRRPAERDGGGEALPAGLHVGDRATSACRSCSTRSSRCCPRRPIARSRARRRTAATSNAPPTTRHRPPRSSGRRLPIRSPDASRCSASSRARSSPIRPSTTRRGTRRSASATCSCCRARRRPPCRRSRPAISAPVAKLKDTLTGDTLGDKADPIVFPPLKFPEPVLAYAIEPKTRGDEDKISTSMHRLEEEDPSIHYSRDPQTKELLLSGQGQLHIEVTVAKLKRRFGVDVNLKPPRIPYRETIKAATEAHGRHKKQTGGHGQFGDCKIRVEPLRARRGLRVRGRHLRRVDSAAVRAGGRKRHPGRAHARLSGRLSRWSTSASRSSTARITTSTRTSCRSSSPARWRSRTR